MTDNEKLGSLPDFLIIGAQRSGTTTLYDLLCHHSEVTPATRKEVHYFNRNYKLGEEHYSTFFQPDGVTGEATPYYLFHPLVPHRVRALVPDVRLIVMLRNPVDRALSQYHLNRRLDNEPLDTFEAAVEAEESRLTEVRSRHPLSHQSPYDDKEYSLCSYLARGRYAEQIDRWLIHFDRSQLLVLKSEDFYENPERSLQHVQSHLGLTAKTLSEDRGHKPELMPGHMGEYEPVSSETRERLGEYFVPHNERLHELLGEEYW